MPKGEPRMAIIDLEWTAKDGRHVSKVCFIKYSPDDCSNSKLKFAYTNNVMNVKEKCSPCAKEFQINDHSDLKESDFVEAF